MGWLRDLMRSRVPPIRSFDALARLALARPDWPPTVRPKPRSLGALFSRLDREAGLEWLDDREQVRTVLAGVRDIDPIRDTGKSELPHPLL